jgi:cell division protein FtsI (penicillin-binding protein 3)
MIEAAEGNSYVLQDLLLGVIPAKAPALLLLMVAQRDKLYPLVKSPAAEAGAEVLLAQKMLPALLAAARGQSATAPPAERDPANFTRFLISRRMEFQEPPGAPSSGVGKMPEVTGLSLRKGLQRLNPYHLLVKIEGSGSIIRQSPAAGTPLQGVGECTLTLAAKREARGGS